MISVAYTIITFVKYMWKQSFTGHRKDILSLMQLSCTLDNWVRYIKTDLD